MNRNEYFTRDIEFLTKYSNPAQLNYAINISIKFKYMYFETPKAGCSTIKRFLIKNECPEIELLGDAAKTYEQFNFLHLREFSPLLNPKQVYPFSELARGKSFFKFCFVRNPYNRILSAYLDKIINNRPQSNQIKQVLGLPPSTNAHISFEQFVRAVCELPVYAMDTHWKVQYHHCCIDSIEYDFIGKVEKMNDEVEYISSKIGLNLSHYKVHSPHKSNSTELIDHYYTNELKKLVFRKYQIDFEHFGYAS